jgi:dihydroflavonol-4-reductase
VRAMSVFDTDLRSVTGDLGRKAVCSSEKARTRLGWSPRPSEETIVDCAESLLERKSAEKRAA